MSSIQLKDNMFINVYINDRDCVNLFLFFTKQCHIYFTNSTFFLYNRTLTCQLMI